MTAPDYAAAGREHFGDQTCPSCGEEHPGQACTAYDGNLLGETE